MIQRTRLLIADTDASIRGIIRIAVKEEGWDCSEATDGIMALKLFRRNTYHLAVLDYNLAELNGCIVCNQIRKSSRIPIILLSVHSGEAERLTGFAAGCNDYIIKPFYPGEVVARIKSLMTLYGHDNVPKKTLVRGGIEIDLQSYNVYVNQKLIRLTPKEYDLLVFFCQNPEIAYSRDALLDLVWGHDFYGSDRTVDTHVKSLRGKIQPYNFYIATVWGVGYKFEVFDFPTF